MYGDEYGDIVVGNSFPESIIFKIFEVFNFSSSFFLFNRLIVIFDEILDFEVLFFLTSKTVITFNTDLNFDTLFYPFSKFFVVFETGRIR